MKNFDKEYGLFLNNIKEKIRSARLQAILLFIEKSLRFTGILGNRLLRNKRKQNGEVSLLRIYQKIYKQIFLKNTAFFKRNIERMRQFAQAYPKLEFTA